MSLGHPVTLVWMGFNHQLLLAWQQVSVGDGVECFNTPTSGLVYSSCDKCPALSTLAVVGVVVTAVLVLLVVAVVQSAVIWHQWR